MGVSTTIATTTNYFSELALGNIPNRQSAGLFGQNPTTGTSYKTLYDHSDVLTLLSGDTQLYASSSSVSDVAVNLIALGIDEDYNIVARTVTLNGQTQVAISGLIFFVNSFAVTGPTPPLGDVYLATYTPLISGVPIDSSTVKSKIVSGNNASRNGFYCVPARHKWIIHNIKPTVGKNDDATFRFKVTQNGGVSIIPSELGIYQSVPVIRVITPFIVPEKTIFEIQSKVSTTTAITGCAIDAELVKV